MVPKTAFSGDFTVRLHQLTSHSKHLVPRALTAQSVCRGMHVQSVRHADFVQAFFKAKHRINCGGIINKDMVRSNANNIAILPNHLDLVVDGRY